MNGSKFNQIVGLLFCSLLVLSLTIHATGKEIYLDFSNYPDGPANTRGIRSWSSSGTDKNPYYGKSLRLLYEGSSLTAEFNLKSKPDTATLTIIHLSSKSSSCRGNGYSPVTISINGLPVVSNYDVAENHGGSHGYERDIWKIEDKLTQGTNKIRWKAEDICTHYWIRRFAIEYTDDKDEEVQKARIKLYRSFAETLGEYYWVEKGNTELEEYSQEFKQDFTDPIEYVKNLASEASGAGYYGDAAEGIKQLTTLGQTLTYYQIGTVENQARAKVTVDIGTFTPKQDLEKIADYLEEGRTQKALGVIQEVLPKIRKWREKVDAVQEEMERKSNKTSWRYKRKEEEKAKVSFEAPDKGKKWSHTMDLSGLKRPLKGTNIPAKVKLHIEDTSFPWERGEYRIKVHDIKTFKWGPDILSENWYETVEAHPNLYPEVKVTFEVLGKPGGNVTFEAYVEGELKKEEYQNPLNELVANFSQKVNKKVCKAARTHLQTVIDFLKAEEELLGS
ncbi:MAG: hypothetical protein ABEJ25_03520 [Candidatus Bipolaricaulia bacterium]